MSIKVSAIHSPNKKGPEGPLEFERLHPLFFDRVELAEIEEQCVPVGVVPADPIAGRFLYFLYTVRLSPGARQNLSLGHPEFDAR